MGQSQNTAPNLVDVGYGPVVSLVGDMEWLVRYLQVKLGKHIEFLMNYTMAPYQKD
jgi:hypothetical protein